MEQPSAQPASTDAAKEDNTFAWLSETNLQDESKPAEVMPWEVEQPTSEPVAAPTEAVSASNSSEISEWLKSLDEPEDDLDALDGQLPAALGTAPSWLTTLPTPAPEDISDEEELPDWLKDSETSQSPADESALESFPEPIDIVEPDQNEAAASLPTALAEIGLIETTEPAAPSVADIPTLPRPPLPGSDKDTQAVQKARELLDRGGLDGAMKEYVKLIRKGKMLEDIIYDLQEAVYSHPVDMIVWQTLGDAYMRLNRLQEALDAYSKAEELLR